jgi:hypothetical protein
MKPLRSDYVLSMSAAAALLAACGGLQPPIDAAGAVQTNTSPGNLQRDGARSAPQQDLIYAMGPKATYILSYDDGSMIGSFEQTSGFVGLCSDSLGNVFRPDRGIIFEYAHGGTKPIAQLPDQHYLPASCSVDGASGNLAVANLGTYPSTQLPGNIAIYRDASGEPTFYDTPQITTYYSCGFDAKGNLFIGGRNSSTPYVFAELPKDSNTIRILNLNEPVTGSGNIQWDGKYLAVGARGADTIYRVSVSGSNATVVDTITLHGIRHQADDTFWLKGSTIITSAGPHSGSLGMWKYPRGGKLKALYHVIKKGLLGGMTVSVAPSH